MSCRCRAIERCRADILTLGNISSQYGLLRNIDDNISGVLSVMRWEISNAVTPDNLDALSNSIGEINDLIKADDDSMIVTCSCGINRLKSELQSMISEDKEEHEREARMKEAKEAARKKSIKS